MDPWSSYAILSDYSLSSLAQPEVKCTHSRFYAAVRTSTSINALYTRVATQGTLDHHQDQCHMSRLLKYRPDGLTLLLRSALRASLMVWTTPMLLVGRLGGLETDVLQGLSCQFQSQSDQNAISATFRDKQR